MPGISCPKVVQRVDCLINLLACELVTDAVIPLFDVGLEISNSHIPDRMLIFPFN